MIPQLGQFTDFALLLLRLMLAVVFVNSGWGMLRDPSTHAKDLGLTRGAILVLGPIEFFGGLCVAFGVAAQLAVIVLILINLGAVQKKIFVWRSGFWGQASAGWSYDLIMIVMGLVVVTTGGGRYVLWY